MLSALKHHQHPFNGRKRATIFFLDVMKCRCIDTQLLIFDAFRQKVNIFASGEINNRIESQIEVTSM